jgi:hypothetical protein
VEQLITPILDGLGFELVGIDYLSGSGRSILRIYIDKDEGITLDDCAHASRQIGDLIDVKDLIPHKYILDKAELEDISDHIAQYNAAIFDLSTLYNLAHVDMNKLLIDVGNGMTIDGIDFNAVFVTGNTFSLDGIHLTPIGNALAAHFFIEAINETYGAKIPQVNITDYYGVQFP